MAPLRASTAFCALALLVASPAAAWSPETRVRMTDDAIKLMPKSLRLALERQRRAVLGGVLEPMTGEDGPEHRAPWAEGSLDRQLEAEALSLVEALGRRTPFASLAERFGRLGHFVMDAGFPPGVGDGGADARYAHFAGYCQTKAQKFPLVFYGHADEALDGGDFRAFALEVMERARAEDRELARAYARAGNPPDPQAFDDRSIPFAIGSLSYSRTVTHVVRAWLEVWRLAGGDLGRTPYLETPVEGSSPGGP